MGVGRAWPLSPGAEGMLDPQSPTEWLARKADAGVLDRRHLSDSRLFQLMTMDQVLLPFPTNLYFK